MRIPDGLYHVADEAVAYILSSTTPEGCAVAESTVDLLPSGAWEVSGRAGDLVGTE